MREGRMWMACAAVAAMVGVITLSQTIFYLRYRYY